MSQLKLFFAVLGMTLVLDYLWIGLLMKSFYTEHMGPIARMEDNQLHPLLGPAAIVYLLMALGIVFFSLDKVSAQAPLWSGFLWGALLGGIIYGVYDFTNYSTLKQWTLGLSLMDMLWGSVLSGALTLFAKLLRDATPWFR